MVTREVPLYLKYPGTKDALRRVKNSHLECVVEFKTEKPAVLLTTSPKELKSKYRIRGSVCLVDDDLIVQFVPKNAGLYTVRIFSDTRELCLPLAFLVDENCEVEGTSYSHPVKPTASYVRRSPALSTSGQQPYLRSAFGDAQSHRESRGGYSAEQSPEREPMPRVQPRPPQSSASPELRHTAHTEDTDGGQKPLARGFTSDPYMNPPEVHQSSLSQPEYQEYSPAHHTTSGVAMRARNSAQGRAGNRVSYISGVGSRRTSMVDDDAHFSGDLHSTVPDKKTFDHLYDEKRRGATSFGARRDLLAFSHNTVVTPDAFKSMAAMVRKKPKKRCGICMKKLKTAKMVTVGEDDFCDPCFRRQYLVRSAIEHFMIPTVEECTVEVPVPPIDTSGCVIDDQHDHLRLVLQKWLQRFDNKPAKVNKKSTKFITTRKTIPNVNLRGLEPNEVKYAQGEFKKFDMEGNGWISRALLIPLMKACFYYTLEDKEIKSLLSSSALQSVIKSYGLDERDEVHEVEFLALLAFVARERQRLKMRTNPHTKFTASDLEMAYAFRQQFQGEAEAQRRYGHYDAETQFQSPQHTSPTHTMSPSPYQIPMSTSMQPVGRRMGHIHIPQVVRSPTEASVQSHMVHPPINLNASMVASPQVPIFSPTSIRRPASNVNPLQLSPYQGMQGHGLGYENPHSGSQQQPAVGFQSPPAPSRQYLEVPRPSPMTNNSQGGHNQSDANGFELPEEDRDDPVDAELPRLPPDKDPQTQTLTRPQPKKKGQDKAMMEQLKLTGGAADSWMMY